MKSNIQAIINGYFSEVNSKYKTVVLLGNLPFSLQITSPNTKYLIKYNFDLLNEEIEIPENCIIAIDGGSISNGTLIGNNTILLNVNQTDNILDEVCRLGTWAKMYYSKEAEEFNFLTIEVIKNLIMNLFPGGIKGFEIVFVEELPTPSEETLYKMYLVPSADPKELNITEEFITLVLKNEDVTTYKWEKIGSTNVNLINYYTKLEVNNLLNNKVDKIENKTLSSNDYTDSEKNKLLNIEPFAQKNIQSDWFQNDISKDDYIKNKPSNATSVSDGFMSKEDYIRLSEFNINNFYTKGEVDLIIDNLEFGIIRKVDALPAVGQEHIIYLVPKEAPATGFDEWIWVADENRFELIGDTNIDLSDYYKKSEVDTLVNTEKTRAQGVEQNLQNEILGQTGAIQTAISNANAATTAANTAAAAANNVNATLNTTTNVVTITDRTGTSKSIDLTNKTNVELEGSVITVTDKDGNESEIDLLDATNERVRITVTTNKENQSVAGLGINVYYNGNEGNPDLTVTTDANGQCWFDAPRTYRYRLVFPTIAGCDPITDVTYQAHASERLVDVEYKETLEPVDKGEVLRVIARKRDEGQYSPASNVTMVIRVDGVNHEIPTDAYGVATYTIPYGKTYTVSIPDIDAHYIRGGVQQYSFTAEMSNRAVSVVYVSYDGGLKIVDINGDDYNFDVWKQLVEQGEKTNEEAAVIKIVTQTLAANNGVFGVDIDLIANGAAFQQLEWQPKPVTLVSSITPPTDGNTPTHPYYYNGAAATQLIINEGHNSGWDMPAFYWVENVSKALGSETYKGFYGSVGQWGVLLELREDFDDILTYIRPNAARVIKDIFKSDHSMRKMTCTQKSKDLCYFYSIGAGNSDKLSKLKCIPFLAM